MLSWIGLMRKIKLEKISCEICDDNNKDILHAHHIKERTELETNNHNTNLLILCPNCHSKIHTNKIQIIGLFNSTKKPYGRSVIYLKDGVCNVPSMQQETSYYGLVNESMKLPESKDNE